MSPLAQQLQETLQTTGPISFRAFMETALYHPEHGYYSAQRVRIGRKGDFFTNVSVGPLFGRLLARQFAQAWEQLGSPEEWQIVEQGAHLGEFARDALSGLQEFAPDCFAAARYWIVEPLETARTSQRIALGDLPVTWARSLEEVPRFTGIHFSNELLDAFPVHLVERTANGWAERYVDAADGRFVFRNGPLSDPRLARHLEVFEDVPVGFVTEVSLGAFDWLATLGERLERGYILAIDYGYSRDEFRERPAGTLSAYSAHQREVDPLARPGEIDLTAHVEFTSLLEHAASLGLEPCGMTDQHRFMVALGKLHFGEIIPPKELRAFKTLMHPALMGAAFKAVCLQKGGLPPLAGFEFARPV